MRFFLIRGGDKTAPRIADASGWEYGTRHDYRPYASIGMLDIRWDKYNWWDYMRKVRRWQPDIAMLPDFTHARQLDTLMMQYEELKQFVPVVALCPKFDQAMSLIKSLEVRIALSVPTTYAGYIPPLEQLAGADIHLLGGSPKTQLSLLGAVVAAGAKVLSIDANYHIRKGIYGQSYSGGRWIQARSEQSPVQLAILSGIEIKQQMLALDK